MKNLRIVFLAVSAIALGACSKGVEKEYVMDVQEVVQVSFGSAYYPAVYCKKSLSAFNYYIIIDEQAKAQYDEKTAGYDFTKLVAKKSGSKEEFTYGPATVTDHGYKFVRWQEAKQ